MSEPWRRSRHAWWRRPSSTVVNFYRGTLSLAGVILLGTANNKRSFRLLPKMSVKVGRLLLPWRGLVSMCSAPFVSPFSFKTKGMMVFAVRESRVGD